MQDCDVTNSTNSTNSGFDVGKIVVQSKEDFQNLPDWQKNILRAQKAAMQAGSSLSQADINRMAIQAVQKPRVEVVQDPVTGQQQTVLQTGPQSWQPMTTGKTERLKSKDISDLSERNTLRKLALEAAEKIKALPNSQLGPMDTRYRQAKQAMGLGSEKEWSEAMRSYNGVKNQLLKMRSGAAVTKEEFARFMEEIGNPAQNDETFKLNFSAFANHLDREYNDKISALQEAGLKLPDSLIAEDIEEIVKSKVEKPAVTRQLGGVTYQKGSDGKWRPVR